jgi:hypothetical protein
MYVVKMYKTRSYRKNHLLSFDGTDCVKNKASNNSSIVTRVVVAVVIFLLSHCLATIVGYTYRHTDWWEGFMKYITEMGSGTMICIPIFKMIDSAIQKLISRVTQAHRQHGDSISLFLFFQNKESKLTKQIYYWERINNSYKQTLNTAFLKEKQPLKQLNSKGLLHCKECFPEQNNIVGEVF